MLVAYYRVSTPKQGASGLGLEAQADTVARFAQTTGEVVAAAYTEVESGRCRRRPQLLAALCHARAVRGALVVAKLDRLSRDTAFLLSLVDGRVPVHFCDMPLLSTGDPHVGRLTVTILAAVAEFESRRIGQRISEALARKKARNGGKELWRVFRPDNLTDADRRKGSRIACEINARQFAAFRAIVRPVVLELRPGRNLAQVAVELNARGYRTCRGLLWTRKTVSYVMRRAARVNP